MSLSVRPCERCGDLKRVQGERYCPFCRRVVLGWMKRDGYLERMYDASERADLGVCEADPVVREPPPSLVSMMRVRRGR